MGWYDNTQIQAPRTIGYDHGQNSTLQAIDLFRRGVNDFAGISNDYRISKGRDVANKAIDDLMAKKPDKTIDPTQHIGEVSRLLAFASPEMRDTVKAYTTSLDTNYGRELQNQQFSKNLELNQEQLKEQIRNNKAMNSLQAQGNAIHASNAAFNRKIQELELAKNGYIPDGKGGFVYNPEASGAFKMMERQQQLKIDKDIIDAAQKISLPDFVEGSKKAMNKGWGPLLGFTVGSDVLKTLFSEASTALNNPATPQNIKVGLATAMMQKNPQGVINLLGQTFDSGLRDKKGKPIPAAINPKRINQKIEPSYGWFEEIKTPETKERNSANRLVGLN